MDLDDILDKINKVGLNNLTKEEKEFLNNSYK
jgi:Golgi nucleoside diphosphatase